MDANVEKEETVLYRPQVFLIDRPAWFGLLRSIHFNRRRIGSKGNLGDQVAKNRKYCISIWNPEDLWPELWRKTDFSTERFRSLRLVLPSAMLGYVDRRWVGNEESWHSRSCPKFHLSIHPEGQGKSWIKHLRILWEKGFAFLFFDVALGFVLTRERASHLSQFSMQTYVIENRNTTGNRSLAEGRVLCTLSATRNEQASCYRKKNRIFFLIKINN